MQSTTESSDVEHSDVEHSEAGDVGGSTSSCQEVEGSAVFTEELGLGRGALFDKERFGLVRRELLSVLYLRMTDLWKVP